MTKQTKDGWIRHRGGKCPVDAGVMVDIRLRDGTSWGGPESGRADFRDWAHTGVGGDIMAYRVCESVIEPVVVANVEAFKMAGPYIVVNDFQLQQVGQLDGPLQWRDRITQIDADIKFEEERHCSNMACMDQERSDLVAKLAAEGFALIAPVAEPVEDMSDWRNWKAGDLLECVNSQSRHYTSGKIYKFISASHHGSVRAMDDREVENGLMPVYFKFHSRPTK